MTDYEIPAQPEPGSPPTDDLIVVYPATGYSDISIRTVQDVLDAQTTLPTPSTTVLPAASGTATENTHLFPIYNVSSNIWETAHLGQIQPFRQLTSTGVHDADTLLLYTGSTEVAKISWGGLKRDISITEITGGLPELNGALSDLRNVNTTGAEDDQVLTYSSGQWTPQPVVQPDSLVTSLTALTDVHLTNVQDQQALLYQGGQWVNVDHTLNTIDNVVISTPQPEETLHFDGTNWVNVRTILGIDGLTDVDLSEPVAAGQALIWDGDRWINRDPLDDISPMYLGSPGISVSSNNIISLDIGTVPDWSTVTASVDSVTDKLLINDGAWRRINLSQLRPTGIVTTLGDNDEFTIFDAGTGYLQRITWASLQLALPAGGGGGGVTYTGGDGIDVIGTEISLDIQGLHTEQTINDADDWFVFYDASAGGGGGLRKAKLNDIVDHISVGELSDVTLSNPSAQQFLVYENDQWTNQTVDPGTLDIEALPGPLTDPMAADDLLAVADASDSNAVKKITLAGVAGSLDLTTLKDVSAASPDDSDVLTYSNGAWSPMPAAVPPSALDDLSDVTAAPPIDHSLLQYSMRLAGWVQVSPMDVAGQISIGDLADDAISDPTRGQFLTFSGEGTTLIRADTASLAGGYRINLHQVAPVTEWRLRVSGDDSIVPADSHLTVDTDAGRTILTVGTSSRANAIVTFQLLHDVLRGFDAATLETNYLVPPSFGQGFEGTVTGADAVLLDTDFPFVFNDWTNQTLQGATPLTVDENRVIQLTDPEALNTIGTPINGTMDSLLVWDDSETEWRIAGIETLAIAVELEELGNIAHEGANDNDVLLWDATGPHWTHGKIPTLSEIENVVYTSLANEQVLQWNATAMEWHNVTPTLHFLTDVSAVAPQQGEVLQWSGTTWTPAGVSGGMGGVTHLSGLEDVAILFPERGETLIYEGSGSVLIRPSEGVLLGGLRVQWNTANPAMDWVVRIVHDDSITFDTSHIAAASADQRTTITLGGLTAPTFGQLRTFLSDPTHATEILAAYLTPIAADQAFEGVVLETSEVGLLNDNPFVFTRWSNRHYDVADLGDVNFTGLADTQLLRYDATADMWVNTNAYTVQAQHGLVLDADSRFAIDISATTELTGGTIPNDSLLLARVGSDLRHVTLSQLRPTSTRDTLADDDDFTFYDTTTPTGAQRITWANIKANLDIADLGGVSPSDPTDGQLLQYDGTNNVWAPVPGTLNTLTDVTIGTLATNQVLQYNGTTWANTGLVLHSLSDVADTSAAGDILTWDATGSGAWVSGQPTTYTVGTGLAADATGTVFSLNAGLNDLNQVTISSPAENQILRYSGTEWENQSQFALWPDATGRTTAPETTDQILLQRPGTPAVARYVQFDDLSHSAVAGSTLGLLSDVESVAVDGDLLVYDADGGVGGTGVWTSDTIPYTALNDVTVTLPQNEQIVIYDTAGSTLVTASDATIDGGLRVQFNDAFAIDTWALRLAHDDSILDTASHIALDTANGYTLITLGGADAPTFQDLRHFLADPARGDAIRAAYLLPLLATDPFEGAVTETDAVLVDTNFEFAFIKWSNKTLAAGDGLAFVDTTFSLDATLDDLNQVSVTSPNTDDVLTWSGTVWTARAAPGAGGGGATSLPGLTDVDVTLPADWNILRYNGTTSHWVNETTQTLSEQMVIDDFADINISNPSDGQILIYDAAGSALAGASDTSIIGGLRVHFDPTVHQARWALRVRHDDSISVAASHVTLDSGSSHTIITMGGLSAPTFGQLRTFLSDPARTSAIENAYLIPVDAGQAFEGAVTATDTVLLDTNFPFVFERWSNETLTSGAGIDIDVNHAIGVDFSNVQTTNGTTIAAASEFLVRNTSGDLRRITLSHMRPTTTGDTLADDDDFTFYNVTAAAAQRITWEDLKGNLSATDLGATLDSLADVQVSLPEVGEPLLYTAANDTVIQPTDSSVTGGLRIQWNLAGFAAPADGWSLRIDGADVASASITADAALSRTTVHIPTTTDTVTFQDVIDFFVDPANAATIRSARVLPLGAGTTPEGTASGTDTVQQDTDFTFIYGNFWRNRHGRITYGAAAGGGLALDANEFRIIDGNTQGQIVKWSGTTWDLDDDDDTTYSAAADGGLRLTSGNAFGLITNGVAAGQILKRNAGNTAWVAANDDDTTYAEGTGIDITGSTVSLDAGLDDLTDVNAPSPMDRQILTWDDTGGAGNVGAWVAAAPGSFTEGTGIDIDTNHVISLDADLNDINDVNAASPTEGQALVWDTDGSEDGSAGAWVAGAGLGATTFDELTDVAITNAAAQQVVSYGSAGSALIGPSDSSLTGGLRVQFNPAYAVADWRIRVTLNPSEPAGTIAITANTTARRTTIDVGGTATPTLGDIRAALAAADQDANVRDARLLPVDAGQDIEGASGAASEVDLDTDFDFVLTTAWANRFTWPTVTHAAVDTSHQFLTWDVANAPHLRYIEADDLAEGLVGRVGIGGLANVSAASATAGQVLKFSGVSPSGTWILAADDDTTYSEGTGIDISTANAISLDAVLNDLNNVNAASPTEGQALVWDTDGGPGGTTGAWVPGAATSGGSTTLAGLTDVTISDPLPDRQILVSSGDAWANAGIEDTWPTEYHTGLHESDEFHFLDTHTDPMNPAPFRITFGHLSGAIPIGTLNDVSLDASPTMQADIDALDGQVLIYSSTDEAWAPGTGTSTVNLVDLWPTLTVTLQDADRFAFLDVPADPNDSGIMEYITAANLANSMAARITVAELQNVTETSIANDHILRRSGNTWINQARIAVGNMPTAGDLTQFSTQTNPQALDVINDRLLLWDASANANAGAWRQAEYSHLWPGADQTELEGTDEFIFLDKGQDPDRVQRITATHTATGLVGMVALSGLANVNAASPSEGQALVWDDDGNEDQSAGAWVPASVSSGGAVTLAGLTDVTITSAADNHILRYNGTTSHWVNQATLPTSALPSIDFNRLSDGTIASPVHHQVLAYESSGSVRVTAAGGTPTGYLEINFNPAFSETAWALRIVLDESRTDDQVAVSGGTTQITFGDLGGASVTFDTLRGFLSDPANDADLRAARLLPLASNAPFVGAIVATTPVQLDHNFAFNLANHWTNMDAWPVASMPAPSAFPVFSSQLSSHTLDVIEDRLLLWNNDDLTWKQAEFSHLWPGAAQSTLEAGDEFLFMDVGQTPNRLQRMSASNVSAGLVGMANLNRLANVNAGSPTEGQSLVWDSDGGAGGTSGAWVAHTLDTGPTTIAGLTDVTLSSLADGEVLKWDSSSGTTGAWVNNTDNDTTYTVTSGGGLGLNSSNQFHIINGTANNQMLRWNGTSWGVTARPTMTSLWPSQTVGALSQDDQVVILDQTPNPDAARAMTVHNLLRLGSPIIRFADLNEIRVDTAVDGDLLVRDGSNWVPGGELDHLTDVTILDPLDGDVLGYQEQHTALVLRDGGTLPGGLRLRYNPEIAFTAWSVRVAHDDSLGGADGAIAASVPNQRTTITLGGSEAPTFAILRAFMSDSTREQDILDARLYPVPATQNTEGEALLSHVITLDTDFAFAADHQWVARSLTTDIVSLWPGTAETTLADDDQVAFVDVGEDPDEAKYITAANLANAMGARITVAELENVTETTVADHHILTRSGTNWINAAQIHHGNMPSATSFTIFSTQTDSHILDVINDRLLLWDASANSNAGAWRQAEFSHIWPGAAQPDLEGSDEFLFMDVGQEPNRLQRMTAANVANGIAALTALTELNNVNAGSPGEGEALVWDADGAEGGTAGAWVPSAVSVTDTTYTALANGGLSLATGNAFSVDISNATEHSAPVHPGSQLLIRTNAGDFRRVSYNNLRSNVAQTTLADADQIPVYDASETQAKYITGANLRSAVAQTLPTLLSLWPSGTSTALANADLMLFRDVSEDPDVVRTMTAFNTAERFAGMLRLGQIGDVEEASTPPTFPDGAVLKRSGNDWVAGVDNDTTYNNGFGLALVGQTFSLIAELGNLWPSSGETTIHADDQMAFLDVSEDPDQAKRITWGNLRTQINLGHLHDVDLVSIQDEEILLYDSTGTDHEWRNVPIGSRSIIAKPFLPLPSETVAGKGYFDEVPGDLYQSIRETLEERTLVAVTIPGVTGSTGGFLLHFPIEYREDSWRVRIQTGFPAQVVADELDRETRITLDASADTFADLRTLLSGLTAEESLERRIVPVQPTQDIVHTGSILDATFATEVATGIYEFDTVEEAESGIVWGDWNNYITSNSTGLYQGIHNKLPFVGHEADSQARVNQYLFYTGGGHIGAAGWKYWQHRPGSYTGRTGYRGWVNALTTAELTALEPAAFPTSFNWRGEHERRQDTDLTNTATGDAYWFTVDNTFEYVVTFSQPTTIPVHHEWEWQRYQLATDSWCFLPLYGVTQAIKDAGYDPTTSSGRYDTRVGNTWVPFTGTGPDYGHDGAGLRLPWAPLPLEGSHGAVFPDAFDWKWIGEQGEADNVHTTSESSTEVTPYSIFSLKGGRYRFEFELFIGRRRMKLELKRVVESGDDEEVLGVYSADTTGFAENAFVAGFQHTHEVELVDGTYWWHATSGGSDGTFSVNTGPEARRNRSWAGGVHISKLD